MNKEVKTMIGELKDHFGCVYVVGEGVEEVWLTEEQFEAVKLPELNEDEQKYYDELKEVKNGDKRGMVSHVNFDIMNLGLTFGHGGYYRIIEAIVKGGYNK